MNNLRKQQSEETKVKEPNNYLNSSRNSDISKNVPGDMAHVLRHAEEAESANEPVETDSNGARAQLWRAE